MQSMKAFQYGNATHMKTTGGRRCTLLPNLFCIADKKKDSVYHLLQPIDKENSKLAPLNLTYTEIKCALFS